MRCLCLILSSLCGFASGLCRASDVETGTITLAGNTYTNLNDWSKDRRLDLNWIRKGEELQITSRWSKLGFTVNSCQAQVNGVKLWLSLPVAARNGTAYLSNADMKNSIEPVLFPPRKQKAKRIQTVCLDPGHGGKDPGNIEKKQQEKKYTLLLAKEIRDLLLRAGLKVKMTRSSDSYIDPELRPVLARRAKSDLFLSLHYNAAPSNSGEVRGIEVYCLTPAGFHSTNGRSDVKRPPACPGNQHDDANILFAYHIQKAIVSNLDLEDRGVRRARFAVLREATIPAVLIEGGFMTDPDESTTIYQPAGRRALARAIVDGLLAYKRLVER